MTVGVALKVPRRFLKRHVATGAATVFDIEDSGGILDVSGTHDAQRRVIRATADGRLARET